MTWRIVEQKKGLGIPFGQPLKNVDCGIDLREEVVGTKIPIAILASLEDDPGLPEDKLVKKEEKMAVDSDGLIAVTQTTPLGR
jgi:hypothetical protein